MLDNSKGRTKLMSSGMFEQRNRGVQSMNKDNGGPAFPRDTSVEYVAFSCYEIADAMIVEREK